MTPAFIDATHLATRVPVVERGVNIGRGLRHQARLTEHASDHEVDPKPILIHVRHQPASCSCCSWNCAIASSEAGSLGDAEECPFVVAELPPALTAGTGLTNTCFLLLCGPLRTVVEQGFAAPGTGARRALV